MSFGKELTHQLQMTFEKIVGKEEFAHNEQFLLFPQHFLLNQKIISSFVNIYDIISLFAAELGEPKIGISGKGLNFICRLQHIYLSWLATAQTIGECLSVQSMVKGKTKFVLTLYLICRIWTLPIRQQIKI